MKSLFLFLIIVLTISFQVSCNKTLGKYVYVYDNNRNYVIHTNRQCKKLFDEHTEYYEVEKLYDALSFGTIYYCPKCVQDWQYDELMKLKDLYKKRCLSMDKLGQLYYALKADGAIQHLNEEEFRRWMHDESNSRKLYDALKADGAVTSDTYEIFADRLGLWTQTSDSLNIKK